MTTPQWVPIELTLASGEGSVRITATSVFSGVNLHSLQSVNFGSDIRYFEPDPHTLALLQSVGEPYFFVDIQQHADLVNGIMFAVQERVYGVLVFGSQCFLDSVKGSSTISSGSIRARMLLDNNKEKMLEQLQTSHENLGARVKYKLLFLESLKPPSSMTMPGVSIDASPLVNEDDPLTFITTRYYNMLYSMTTPLNYFPKTAFTRLANICHSSRDELVGVLTQLVLSVDEFDKRHEGKYGCLCLEQREQEHEQQQQPFKFAAEQQAHATYVEKIRDTIEMTQVDNSNADPDSPQAKSKAISEQKMSNIVLDLKIREAHLQIIVVLELLSWQITNEANFLELCQQREKKETQKAQKMSRPSLVRKGKSKRKIVPTFLGMGVQLQPTEMTTEPLQTTTHYDEYILYSILSNLLERLNLWDTLKTKGTKADSSKSFLGYVVVPFYNKKMPVVVKFVIERIRGLSLKVKRKSERSRPKQRSVNEDSELPKSSKIQSTQNRGSKYDKNLIKRPTLKQSLSGIEDLRPAISLRRSKSSLASSKNLERRQIDVSVSLKSFSEVLTKSEAASAVEALPTQSFIFARARKTSTAQAPVPALPSYSQVEATPMKQTRHSQVADTPLSNIMGKSDAQVIASSGSKKISLHDRLKAASFDDGRDRGTKNLQMSPPRAKKAATVLETSPKLSTTVIDSSPILTRTVVDSSPINRNGTVISDSSPENMRTLPISRLSSIRLSVQRNRRPGDQASPEESPSYISYGDSPSKRQKRSGLVSRALFDDNYVDTDTDED